MMVRVFIDGPRDLGSIPGHVIPKTKKKKKKKKYFMPPCLTLSIIKVPIKGKGSNSKKGVAPLV